MIKKFCDRCGGEKNTLTVGIPSPNQQGLSLRYDLCEDCSKIAEELRVRLDNLCREEARKFLAEFVYP